MHGPKLILSMLVGPSAALFVKNAAPGRMLLRTSKQHLASPQVASSMTRPSCLLVRMSSSPSTAAGDDATAVGG
eukprot:CAMPEP_0171953064 /NCGR_PEP_ID=MMETSP0993-20121228/93787_1 /TAXON_ID=483369 /ORGANISM="non described non described, Strain CCMP2098" /LENGTH=73 /DNA_ID=CAMNT_0012598655 /DNA_START=16 /DNA_END=233 /DNA_ORIENTATION=-